MIDSYIILNRNSKIIIKIFIIIILLIIILLIWAINTLKINRYFLVNSEIQNLHSYYYLKVLIPQKEVKDITNKKLMIDDKIYKFNIYKIDENIIYKDGVNYRTIYLEIYDLDNAYKINGYQVNARFIETNKKIINILKE